MRHFERALYIVLIRARYGKGVMTMTDNTEGTTAGMSDNDLERMVARIVGRSHVSVSDKGIRIAVGRKLKKSVQGVDRTRILDAAVRVHHANQNFFHRMKF
jgi:hypothetical protein